MSFIDVFTTATMDALQTVWGDFILKLPEVLLALVFFIIGWLIAIAIGKIITEILKKLSFNRIFEQGSWKNALAKAEIKVDASEFVGAIVKWVLVIVVLTYAVGILGLSQFSGLLNDVLGYLPNVVIAVLIFVVTVIIVDIVEKVVRASVESIKVGYGQFVSVIVKWAIWIFAIFTILEQLIPNSTTFAVLFQALITGIIAFLVISLGLAFGLGGKEVAGEFLRDLKGKLKD